MPEHSALRPAGYVEWTDLDGKEFHGETLQCAHCGMHWIIRPGSGQRRGWCLKCGKPTCGKPACDLCDPYKRRRDE